MSTQKKEIEKKIVTNYSRPLESKEVEVDGSMVGVVRGYLAAFTPDRGGITGLPDQFVQGCFDDALQDYRDRGRKSIPVRDVHGKTIGVIPIDSVQLDSFGMLVEMQLNLDTQQGREAYSLSKQGAYDSMSISYSTKLARVESGIRKIYKVDEIYEGSLVDQPANLDAMILEVKNVQDVKAMTKRELEKCLLETKAFSKEAVRYIMSFLPEDTKEHEEKAAILAELTSIGEDMEKEELLSQIKKITSSL